MEVAELSAEDNVVTKEGSWGKGKTSKIIEDLAVTKEKNEQEKVKNKPRVTYSKEELLNLRESPASKLWPRVLSDEHTRNGVWDPEAWHQSFASEKRCASPADELKKQLLIEDDIVLSPQRQSFVQGCHIPQSAPERILLQERGKSGLSRTSDREKEGRSRLTGRVGKGRLDYKERLPLQERNKDSDESSGKYREGDERADRDRGYGKDKDRGFREKERKKSREENARGRNIQVRKKPTKEERNQEPEWFTFGPSSQFETMELKGFDDLENLKKSQERRKSASEEIKAILSVGKNCPVNGELNRSSPETVGSLSRGSATDKTVTETKASSASCDDSKQPATKPFDINDFFMSDSLIPFTGGVDQTSSRFCQFFGQPGSNYSSSRSGSVGGLSSGGANTPRTPSPAPNYLFTPITPLADDSIESRSLAAMLQKSQVNVQPLLDEVMSSEKDANKVMGSVRAEDIEADINKDSTCKSSVKKKEIINAEHNKENIGKGGETSNKPEQMVAFNMLVEKMKSSGTLPEKPQPAISGLPARLLPRPPSPKRKTPRHSPSPLVDMRRSPSPAELLKVMTMTAPLSDPRPPSPPQVVPQMNRPPSPLEMFHKINNSVVASPQELFSSPMLRRSPSPLAMLAQQRQSPPLGFGAVNLQMVPHQVKPVYQMRRQPSSVPPRVNPQTVKRQQDRYVTPGGPPEQRGHTVVNRNTVSSQSASPRIIDRSFMPTSVMRKIHQDRMDQKTPKTVAKTSDPDHSSEKDIIPEEQNSVNRNDLSALGTYSTLPVAYSPRSRPLVQSEIAGDPIKGALFQRHQEVNQASLQQDLLASPRSIKSSEALLTQDGSPVLQKPTAFKPLPGSPQVPFSSLKSGVNSDTAFPLHLFNQNAGSPARPAKTFPHSAPCTPQRHPLVDKTALLSPQQLMSKGMMTRDDGNKPLAGLFGQTGSSIESPSKSVRGGITKVVGINDGRPLAHSFEQHVHGSTDSVASFEDAKRGESLLGAHLISQNGPNNMSIPRMNSDEVTIRHEGLPLNHPSHRIHGGGTRPTSIHQAPRQFHGQRPSPHLLNGRMSPSGMPVMHGHPGQTPFNSPMPGMGMPPRSAMLPGMMPPHLHPAYLRMMSSAGSPPMAVPSPGMSPLAMRMQQMPPQSAGRYPFMSGHHPAMLYGGRPSPDYPAVSPAAAAAAAAMMGARSSPHIHPQSGLQQGRRGNSPVMNLPPQSHSPGGGGNVLSKWFGEDVLQQVQPGQRSATPDLARKVLSVEELERQHAAAFN